MCVYTVALMKTCVQLISPVYLRMCSDECCCRAVFILYTFYLSVSLSIPHSISLSLPPSLSPTLSPSFILPTDVRFFPICIPRIAPLHASQSSTAAEESALH